MMFLKRLSAVGVMAVMALLLGMTPVLAGDAESLFGADVKLDGENSSAKLEFQMDKDIEDPKFLVKHVAKKIFGLSPEMLMLAEVDVDADADKAELKLEKDGDDASFKLEITADAEDGTVSVSAEKEGSEKMIKKFLHKVHTNLQMAHEAHVGMDMEM